MNRSKMFRSSLSAEPNSKRQRYRANVSSSTKFNRSKSCRTDYERKKVELVVNVVLTPPEKIVESSSLLY
jgi:hypothetical protein